MRFKLADVSYTDISDMIQEAKTSGAFLPLKSDDDVFLDFMKTLEGTPGTHFFNFQADHRTVGFAVLLPHRDKSLLSIGPVYVCREFQGQGLGTRLIEEIIAWAKKEGLNGLFTKTWGENARSRAIFEKLGFEFIDEKPVDRVNGDSTVHYLLSLP